MGLFDSVWFTCPDCGQNIEVQSKADDPYLNNYKPDAVPGPIAGDILGCEIACGKCGQSFVIVEIPPDPRPTMKLGLVKLTSTN